MHTSLTLVHPSPLPIPDRVLTVFLIYLVQPQFPDVVLLLYADDVLVYVPGTVAPFPLPLDTNGYTTGMAQCAGGTTWCPAGLRRIPPPPFLCSYWLLTLQGIPVTVTPPCVAVSDCDWVACAPQSGIRLSASFFAMASYDDAAHRDAGVDGLCSGDHSSPALSLATSHMNFTCSFGCPTVG